MFDEARLEPIVTSRPDGAADVADPPSEVRFASCRWQQPAANGTAAHCQHPEVLPFAGTGGFSVDAWCPGCGHFKLRRTRRR